MREQDELTIEEEYRPLIGAGDTLVDATLKLLLVSEAEFHRAKEEFIANKALDGTLTLVDSIEGTRKFHELELKMELREKRPKSTVRWLLFDKERKQYAEWQMEEAEFVRCGNNYEGQYLPALSLALLGSADGPSLERTRLICRAACLLRLSLVKTKDEVFKGCQELLLRDKKTFEEVKKEFMECSDAGVCARSWCHEIVGKVQPSHFDLHVGSGDGYLPASPNFV